VIETFIANVFIGGANEICADNANVER